MSRSDSGVEDEQLRADPLRERPVDRAGEHHPPLLEVALGQLLLEAGRSGRFGDDRVVQLHGCRS